MSVPRQLSLLKDDAGLAVVQSPVISPLRTNHSHISAAKAGTLGNMQAPFELDLQFGRPSEPVFGIRIYSDEQHWTEIGLNQPKREFYIDRTKSGAAVTPDFPARTTAPLIASRSYDFKLIVDRSSVESFAQNGTIAMTDLIFPASHNSKITLFSSSGKAVSVKGDLWKLRSIWR
jgi:sucrose-6-phosphate hydrolase SacC (GH32 family)